MKTFRSYLEEAELKGSVRFGRETFKLKGFVNKHEAEYELQGKYKGALYINVDEDDVRKLYELTPTRAKELGII